MLNREIMKKTITDLKNNKEFLKKERKIEKYQNWINLGQEGVFKLSAIPAIFTMVGGSIVFSANEESIAACMGAALTMAVSSFVAETYCVVGLPEKQKTLIDEIDNTIKHNYVKNGALEYYQQRGLTKEEATDMFSKFCAKDLEDGIPIDCSYSYKQYDKDMEKYIEENDGFNYNDFAVLDDTSEMVE